MALIRPFNVPRALLIAASAGTIVVDIAVPIRLIAATMAPKSMPSCALTGCGAISDTMSTKTRRFVRCPHNTCRKCLFGSIPFPPYLNNVVVSSELTHHVGLALADGVCVRQDGRLFTKFGRQHSLHHGLILNRRDQAGAREVCRRTRRRLS